MTPQRQIRASYDAKTIRVYQAYSDAIADKALAAQTFVSPPFKMERMTWIKPSFLWMMYRAGYGHKDDGQKRILAIDITHEGLAWALDHSCGSKAPEGLGKDAWQAMKAEHPVRIQWDPERNLKLSPLDHRSIQIGLSGEAVKRYMEDWVVRIIEITDVAHEISKLVDAGDLDAARALCPVERVYDEYDDVQTLGSEH